MTKTGEGARPLERWDALDITRGWTMLVLIAIAPIQTVWGGEGHGAVPTFIATQLSHAPWDGVRYMDIGLAGFVFFMGTSVPLALDARLRRGSREMAIRHVLSRSLALYAVGMFLAGGMLSPVASRTMFFDVLQRLALCYLTVSAAYLFLTARVQVAVCATVIALYALASSFMPFPGAEHGRYAPGSNAAAVIDHALFGTRTLFPEGFFSSIGAASSCLLGSITCQWLRRLPRAEATRHLLVLAVGAIGGGLLLATWVPLNKRLWSTSYLVLTYGTSCLHFGVFSLLVTRVRPRWFFPAVVIGSSSLAPYVVHELLPLENYAQRLVGGPDLHRVLGSAQPYCVAFVMFVLGWLPAYVLYRQKKSFTPRPK